MATVPPTKEKLTIKRGKKTSTTLVPRPSVIVDTREQRPYEFSNFKNWLGCTVTTKLDTGDYSIEGYEHLIALERKTLSDMIGSLTSQRERFLREMQRLSSVKYRCLCIEASRTDIKTTYSFTAGVKAHPNGIMGSLDAIAARYGILIHYGDNRPLSEEFAAS